MGVGVQYFLDTFGYFLYFLLMCLFLFSDGDFILIIFILQLLFEEDDLFLLGCDDLGQD